MLTLLRKWFDLRHDQDENEVIDRSIRSGVRIGGTNLWVLIFAILIASVGLNVNSTAVVIGAMLISPLMGPLLGIGYGAGISDYRLIRSAARSLAIFVALSLLTSTAYFLLSPLSQAHTELLARTTPTLWDVLIAFFGGCAGIVAQTRRDVSTIVPGAAIATALMPPLCTAGYGVASGNWVFAGGALYLFLINAFFIALATYLFVKLLRLPEHEEADPQHQRRAHVLIGLCMLALTLPSAYLAYGLVQDQLFLAASKEVTSALERQPGVIMLSKELSLPKRKLTIVVGGDPVTRVAEAALQQRLQSKGFVRAKLVLRHVGAQKLDVDALREQLRKELLSDRDGPADERSAALDAMRVQLAKFDETKATQAQLIVELLAQYPAIAHIAVGEGSSIAREGAVRRPALVLAIDAAAPLDEAELVRIRAGLTARFPERRISVLQSIPPPPAPRNGKRLRRRGN
ncbi:DUF389 domain-containing protein [Massilia sp. P8910]|uniref:DUF389 domain-containing protein n=1 Tax=Massilia antarctica TaxID=2765360 RepID=UPI001E2B543E|nr:DUF389 domain-containing protein [Massilia antarctica]MCE3602366.1 DUF389 domain-containing protein [Massilia antarctica]